MPKPARNSGFRPQLSAVRPTMSAIGSMTIWAATMQADIMAVASFGWAMASFWPTSGSSAALAKWNSIAQAPIRPLATATSQKTGRWLIQAPLSVQVGAASTTGLTPGGPGLREPATNAIVSSWLKAQSPRTRRMVSVCTGVYGLAAAGLLDGRRAATHWRWAADARRCFPQVKIDANVLYVQDPPIFTSAGVTAGIDLALSLVENDYGEGLALAIARLPPTDIVRHPVTRVCVLMHHVENGQHRCVRFAGVRRRWDHRLPLLGGFLLGLRADCRRVAPPPALLSSGFVEDAQFHAEGQRSADAMRQGVEPTTRSLKAALAQAGARFGMEVKRASVSYTPLTLPTIYSG